MSETVDETVTVVEGEGVWVVLTEGWLSMTYKTEARALAGAAQQVQDLDDDRAGLWKPRERKPRPVKLGRFPRGLYS